MRSRVSCRSDRLAGWQDKSWGLWFILVFLLTLALCGTELLSRGWGNAGMVVLERALFAAPEGGAQDMAVQAETLLRRATAYVPGNRSAWRGLGFALAIQRQEDEAITAWQRAGGMAEELVQWGEEARKAERFEEALEWYERAAEVEPRLGDPWYYVGLAYEEMERWGEALKAYEQAIEVGAFTDVGRSSPHYRMGVIYQWRLEPRQTNAALAAYEAAIEVDDFSDDGEAADCHHKRGEILWWTGGDPDEYIAEYQQAIELNHKLVSAHILLGVAYYIRYKDVAMAEVEIQQAMELSPRNHWVYYHLGEIYRQEGQVDKAAAMFERALEIAPEFEAARQRLQALGESE